MNFIRYTPILRKNYDNVFFLNFTNSLNVLNVTKYINVNNKTLFIYVNYHEVCNAVSLDDLTDNKIIKTRSFNFLT